MVVGSERDVLKVMCRVEASVDVVGARGLFVATVEGLERLLPMGPERF